MKEKMNYSEMKDEELIARQKSLSEEIFVAKQKVRLGQFKRFSEFSRLRKEIARIRTHLRGREISASVSQQGIAKKAVGSAK